MHCLIGMAFSGAIIRASVLSEIGWMGGGPESAREIEGFDMAKCSAGPRERCSS